MYWFRFTIRDLCWLTVVAALAAAWWAERWQKENEKANFWGATMVLDDMKEELDRVDPGWREGKRYRIDVLEEYAKKARAERKLPSR